MVYKVVRISPIILSNKNRTSNYNIKSKRKSNTNFKMTLKNKRLHLSKKNYN